MSWYKKTVDRGDLDAIDNDGNDLDERYLGEADKREAMSWCKKATDQRDIDAICQYGYCLAGDYLG
jgi:TPR repeat protein